MPLTDRDLPERPDRAHRSDEPAAVAPGAGTTTPPGAATVPEVSVVMPVYNDEVHLADAVGRVLAQTGVDLELVLVDDGSTDGTARAARRAAAEDDRVRLVELPSNVGVAAARRHGVEAARGTWVWFVDSDDDWPAEAASVLLANAVEGPAEVDVVVATAVLVPVAGRARQIRAPRLPARTGPESLRMLLQGKVTGHLWNKLFSRGLLLSIEFPVPRVQSDLALVANALAAARTVTFCSARVYEYKKRRGSVITSRHRRADSLASIHQTVVAAALRSGLSADSPEVAYFRLRYIALSGFKDALSGAYGDEESRALVALARRRVGPAEVWRLAARGDKRLLLALLVHAPRPLQLQVMRRR